MWFIIIFNAHCLTHKVTTAQYNDAYQLVTNMCKEELFHEQIHDNKFAMVVAQVMNKSNHKRYHASNKCNYYWSS